MTQEIALEILKTGKNVFLTGEPGSGKTFTINKYVKYLQENDVCASVTASTGIAATHISGRTIHSWSGIGIKEDLTKADISNIRKKDYITARIKSSRVLIIDEISMLSARTFSLVDLVCRKVRKSQEPFGGIQVVLVGDFFQLPPIIKKQNKEEVEQKSLLDEDKDGFVYNSLLWEELNLTVCYLTEQYRQDDKDFLCALSTIRSGNIDKGVMGLIRSRMVEKCNAPNDALRFYSHNRDVDSLNSFRLSQISKKPRFFKMKKFGHTGLTSSMAKNCLSPEKLCLKVGAFVMFTKNSLEKDFVNGTVGVVKKFCSETGLPIVEVERGREILVEPMSWTLEEFGHVVAEIRQVPLRLAWAVTVHKSQGMSLDIAVMDLSKVFEFGQGYVALSRVKRLSGLYLLGLNDTTFEVSKEALEKDGFFKKLSKDAESWYKKKGKKEISILQRNFTCSS